MLVLSLRMDHNDSMAGAHQGVTFVLKINKSKTKSALGGRATAKNTKARFCI